ncbi:MAG: amidohydrolase [Planctomycetota bacterium]|nr:MAG: amidohydrolase [Planctomycetota bacterium]
MPSKIIDAHQHFWELGRFDTRWLQAPRHQMICRDYRPEHLKPLIDAAGISRTIFVQTQHNLDENRWALDFARQNDWICGVVGWIDLASPECEAQLAEFRANPKFVGVRHIVQDELDDDFIIRPELLRGLRVLERQRFPFDLLFYVKHLRHAATLGRELPELPMVLDHLAKPVIKEQRMDSWEEHFRAAAAFPNICCKLSGMVTEADWDTWEPGDLQPYVDLALECFGPRRLMFGSDWPVCELAGTYQQVFNALRDCLSRLSANEQAEIFGGTAQRFYGLS